jgi:hypothetical protein
MSALSMSELGSQAAVEDRAQPSGHLRRPTLQRQVAEVVSNEVKEEVGGNATGPRRLVFARLVLDLAYSIRENSYDRRVR